MSAETRKEQWANEIKESKKRIAEKKVKENKFIPVDENNIKGFGGLIGKRKDIDKAFFYYMDCQSKHDCRKELMGRICLGCLSKTILKFPLLNPHNKSVSILLEESQKERLERRDREYKKLGIEKGQTKLIDVITDKSETVSTLPDEFYIIDKHGKTLISATTPKELEVHDIKKQNPNREYLYGVNYFGTTLKLSALLCNDGIKRVSFGVSINGQFKPIPMDMHELNKLYAGIGKAKRRLKEGHKKKKGV